MCETSLLEYMRTFLASGRDQKFMEVLRDRTRHMTLVLEDIYQSHNASAVLRTCDCFGVQDVHIIENRNEYILNPEVTLGSSKWLDLYRYNEKDNNTLDCLNQLKKKGYRIVATTPHTDDILLEDLSIEKPFALIFGTELKGVSEIAMQAADEYVKIPMFGFTESFNISVSAAICLYELNRRLRESRVNWRLSEEEKESVHLAWARASIRSSALLEKAYYQNKEERNPSS